MARNLLDSSMTGLERADEVRYLVGKGVVEDNRDVKWLRGIRWDTVSERERVERGSTGG